MKRRQFLSGSMAIGAGLVLGGRETPAEAGPRRNRSNSTNSQKGNPAMSFETTQASLRT